MDQAYDLAQGRLTLEVDVVLVRDAEDVVALVRFNGLYEVSLRVFEMHFDPAAGSVVCTQQV